jgi:hypothetical protein
MLLVVVKAKTLVVSLPYDSRKINPRTHTDNFSNSAFRAASCGLVDRIAVHYQPAAPPSSASSFFAAWLKLATISSSTQAPL